MDGNLLRWPDLIVIFISFAGVLFLGPIFSKKTDSSEGYFLADGKMPGWLVGFSLMATIISSMSFLAMPGFAYAENWRYLPPHLTWLLAAVLSIFLFMPLFRRGHLSSAYEYLEKRYGFWARAYAGIGYILFQTTKAGIVLYAISLPFQAMTGLSVPLFIVIMAKEKGVTVSVDLNFRNKLWKWDPACDSRELARKTMKEILKHVDVMIGNEEDAFDVLGVRAGDTNVNAGHLDVDRYPQVAAEIKKQFPQLSHIAFTLRESVSASHNNWGAMLVEADSGTCHFAPTVDGRYRPYAITHIVDRVGGGDSFSAGLIYSLLKNMPASEAVAFAAAASCLKHSIPGDFNLVPVQDVIALVGGNASGRVQR